MVKYLLCIVLSLQLSWSFGQEENNFYAQLVYEYSNLDSFSIMQQKFMPGGTIIYGNDSVLYQTFTIGFLDIVRKVTKDQDSVEHFINALGKKIKFRAVFDLASDDYADFKYSTVTDTIQNVALPIAIGNYRGTEFPCYYIKGIPNNFFPRLSRLKGIPLQYKLTGMDKGLNALVFVKELKRSIPDGIHLRDPEGYEEATEEELESIRGYFK